MEEKPTIPLMASMASGYFEHRLPEDIKICELEREVARLKADTFANKVDKALKGFLNRLYHLIPMRECDRSHDDWED